MNKDTHRQPRRRLAAAAAALALSLGAGVASADVVYLGEEEFQGTGLGTVNTLLTLQGQGGASTESGGVQADGAGEATFGDAKTGESQTQLRTLGDVGIESASDLRLVFNATEPGNDQTITVDELTLSFYDGAGATLYSASLAAPVELTGTFNGIGSSGFFFGLNDAQAAEAQAAVFGGDFSSVRVGLSSALSNADAGPDTFFIASASATPVPAIPEPETWALMLGGLAAVGTLARRRQRKN